MDEASLQRRLQKALQVVDKLKKKEVFEQEVNKELAKRNEALKRQVMALEWKLLEISKAMIKVDESFEHAEDGSGQLSLENVSWKSSRLLSPLPMHTFSSLPLRVLSLRALLLLFTSLSERARAGALGLHALMPCPPELNLFTSFPGRLAFDLCSYRLCDTSGAL